MSEKSKPNPLQSSRAYLFVGITFVAVSMVFLATKAGAIWIVFLALGITFMSLSVSLRPKADAEAQDDPEGPVHPEQPRA